MKANAAAEILTAAGRIARAMDADPDGSAAIQPLFHHILDVYLQLVAEVNSADVGLTRDQLAAMVRRLAAKDAA